RPAWLPAHARPAVRRPRRRPLSRPGQRTEASLPPAGDDRIAATRAEIRRDAVDVSRLTSGNLGLRPGRTAVELARVPHIMRARPHSAIVAEARRSRKERRRATRDDRLGPHGPEHGCPPPQGWTPARRETPQGRGPRAGP